MTRSRLRAAFLALCLGVLIAGACDDGAAPPGAPNEPPPDPVPGDMVATLVSPNGAEGAAVFETTSETIRDVSAETGDLFFGTLTGTTRIIVVLETPGVIRFTLAVDDVNQPPSLKSTFMMLPLVALSSLSKSSVSMPSATFRSKAESSSSRGR